MRVLYFSEGYTTHDHRFLGAIARGGAETLFLRRSAQQRGGERRPLPAGVRELGWPQAFPPGDPAGLRSVLAEQRPTLVHAGPVPTCAALAAAAGAGSPGQPPLLSMSWGSDLLVDAQQPGPAREAARQALAASTWLFADCQAVVQAAAGLGFDRQRTTVFPWGVDLRQFRPLPAGAPSALRARLGWEEALVVLSLRSWEPVYDVPTVLRGFALAARQEPRLHLLLLSDGSLAEQIHTLIPELGLADAVHLAGRIAQEQLPAWYQAADLYLSASLSDGSSVSLLEALASGLPALVSDIPGNREWVHEGEAGLLFPPAQPAALAAGLLRLAAEPALRASCSAAARRVAEERADWDQNQRLIHQTYRKALQP